MSMNQTMAASLVTPAGKSSYAGGEAAIKTADVTVDYGDKRALKGTSLSSASAPSQPSSALQAAASPPSCAASIS